MVEGDAKLWRKRSKVAYPNAWRLACTETFSECINEAIILILTYNENIAQVAGYPT